MRKSRAMAVSLAILAVAGAANPARSSPVPASAAAAQMAYASWIVEEGDRATLYFAAGVNQAPEEWPSLGFVGKTRCKRIEHGHHVKLVCRGRQKPTELMPGDFTVNPLLTDGELTLVKDGFTHEVSWTGSRGTPKPFWHQHAGNDVEEVLVMAWMNRRARARGTLYGNEMAPTRKGFIGEAVQAIVSTYPPIFPGVGPAEFRDGMLVIHETRLVKG